MDGVGSILIHPSWFGSNNNKSPQKAVYGGSMAYTKFSFKIDVTSRKVIVYLCDNVFETVGEIMGKVVANDLDDTFDAVTFGTDTGNSIVFFEKNPPIDIVVHEVYHIANDVSTPIGIVPSAQTEEYFAYLNQMIFKKIFDRLVKENKPKEKIE